MATDAGFRGRGNASYPPARLGRLAHDAGCDLVYLTARDDAASRIYERIGFVPAKATYDEIEPR